MYGKMYQSSHDEQLHANEMFLSQTIYNYILSKPELNNHIIILNRRNLLGPHQTEPLVFVVTIKMNTKTKTKQPKKNNVNKNICR